MTFQTKPELLLPVGNGEYIQRNNKNTYHKYEVVYTFNGESYKRKRYIARVITNDIWQYMQEGNTQYITVQSYYPVDAKRYDYLSGKNKHFELVRYC